MTIASFPKKVISGVFLGLFISISSGCDNTGTNIGVVKEEQQSASWSIKGSNILVFSKTVAFRHDSIPAGIDALKKMAKEQGFQVEFTEDSELFFDDNLKKYNAIVFLNTTGDVLNKDQEIAMERYIQAGGGFVGVHAAVDTEWEGDWFWYRNLVGAVFKSHPMDPNVQTATVEFTDREHISTTSLPETIEVADEWYNFRDMYEFINTVAKVDESTYSGGEHGHDHPLSWFHEFDGGRAFYTGMGHTSESFSNPHLLEHLLGGIKYVIAQNHSTNRQPALDYGLSRPEPSRFVKKTLVESLDEPVKFDFFPDGDALIALRPGKFLRVNVKTGESVSAGAIEPYYDKLKEFGLLGVAVDPKFSENKWIYVSRNIKDDAGKLNQRLSRFQWKNNEIDDSSEQTLIQYLVDDTCCHTGGDIHFGNNGELFFSTGDNTNPHEQDGYSPIDFREGFSNNDALRSAGNTKDFRGKILRILPKKEGGYDIPNGNLFTDASEGLPEIYVMGTRNPYTISYDKNNNILYFGDIGPDATNGSDIKGSRGYDEVNRVPVAGNYGWPLLIGNNNAYNTYDYVAQQSGALTDYKAPMNTSPNNTGTVSLPVAQPAFISYPYAASEEFPELASGGRSALVAGVYNSTNYPESKNRYPSYYDNKLFIADFMRAWVKVVSINDAGQITKIEPFAPQIPYSLPIAAKFSPDGSLYVLEYGMSWFVANPDARLSKIEFVGFGNRPPHAEITLDKTQAGVPASLEVSALNSYDPDGDEISYQWNMSCNNGTCSEKVLGTDSVLRLNIEKPGVYEVLLTVKDVNGETSSERVTLEIGNEPANITYAAKQNKSFYWPDSEYVDYQFVVDDKEDGRITDSGTDGNPRVTFRYQSAESIAEGHKVVDNATYGKELADTHNCTACHKLEEKVVGPALREVAKKYENDENSLAYIANKIGSGGGGVWGDMNMPAFPGLSDPERYALAEYVMSLNGPSKDGSLPLSGRIAFDQHVVSTDTSPASSPMYKATGNYIFNVNYTDKGAESASPIQVDKTFVIKSHRFDLESIFDPSMTTNVITRDSAGSFKFIKFKSVPEWSAMNIGQYDLTGIRAIQLGALFISGASTWHFELRVGGMDGELLSSGELTGGMRSYFRTSFDVKETTGLADLYLVLKSENMESPEIRIKDISFEK